MSRTRKISIILILATTSIESFKLTVNNSPTIKDIKSTYYQHPGEFSINFRRVHAIPIDEPEISDIENRPDATLKRINYGKKYVCVLSENGNNTESFFNFLHCGYDQLNLNLNLNLRGGSTL